MAEELGSRHDCCRGWWHRREWWDAQRTRPSGIRNLSQHRPTRVAYALSQVSWFARTARPTGAGDVANHLSLRCWPPAVSERNSVARCHTRMGVRIFLQLEELEA